MKLKVLLLGAVICSLPFSLPLYAKISDYQMPKTPQYGSGYGYMHDVNMSIPLYRPGEAGDIDKRVSPMLEQLMQQRFKRQQLDIQRQQLDLQRQQLDMQRQQLAQRGVNQRCKKNCGKRK